MSGLGTKAGEKSVMINVESQYPDKIDPMLFFQDNSLDKVTIINTYNNLIAQKKYDEANEYIGQQEKVHRYSADYFNAIENRIYSLQEYLLAKTKENPFVYSDEEPVSGDQNVIWIG